MAFDLFDTMRKFAYEILKTPDDPLGAAMRAFVNDDITASQVAYVWPTNPHVLRFKEELLAEYGAEHFLPSKSDIARELFSIGQSKAYDASDRVKALQELAKILGYVEKPSAVTVNTGDSTNRVMIVRDHGTLDDWETRALAHQRQLIAGNTKVPG